METTLVKGLRVLEAMSQDPELVSITAISKRCGISKSNTFRLLQTLEHCGYVFREPITKTYRPSLRQWQLGQRVFDRMSLPTVASRYLSRLATETLETVHLSVFDNDEVLYVDRVESTQSVRTYVSAGEREPAYCTCSGKAMLAYMPQEIVQRVAADMVKFTEHTVTNPKMLDRQLAEIRDQGYAVTSGEYRSEVLGFARAIRTSTNHVIGAIGLAGPKERMNQKNKHFYVQALLHAVSSVERDLGFADPVETEDGEDGADSETN